MVLRTINGLKILAAVLILTSCDQILLTGACDADDIDVDSRTLTLVPTATISIDGDSSDWSGIDPVMTDSTGDVDNEYIDFTAFYLAQDDNYLYIRIEVNTSDLSSADTANYEYYFQPSFYVDDSHFYSVTMFLAGSYATFTYGIYENDTSSDYVLSDICEQAQGTTFIEVAVPKYTEDDTGTYHSLDDKYRFSCGSSYNYNEVSDGQDEDTYIKFQ